MLGFVLLPMRVAAIALGMFGVLALMFAATGTHGVVSYAVALRRREIAIRIAVGATRRSILQSVFRRIAIVIAAGSLLGVPLALAMQGRLGSIVYQAGRERVRFPFRRRCDGRNGRTVRLLAARRRVLRVHPAAALLPE